MSSPTLPIIDISPFLSSSASFNQAERADCALKLSQACAEHGFFYLTNHGIPTSTTNHVLDLARRFFLDCAPTQKEAIKRREPGNGDGDGARGYQCIGENVTGGRRDWHEAIDWYAEWDESDYHDGKKEPPYQLLRGRNPWPSEPAELKQVYSEYIEQVKAVGTAVVLAMGYALGLGEGEKHGEGFDVFVNATRKSFWVMRMIGYPGLPAEEQKSRNTHTDGQAELLDAAEFSCGEHTDYGCVTLLLADSTRGALQVQRKDGQWIDADPISGAFVVNIGDMMERWTNGLWKSTLHRVVHRGERFRVSVPFFFEPDWDATIRPLEKCIRDSGKSAQFNEIKYGDHLVSKVTGNFY